MLLSLSLPVTRGTLREPSAFAAALHRRGAMLPHPAPNTSRPPEMMRTALQSTTAQHCCSHMRSLQDALRSHVCHMHPHAAGSTAAHLCVASIIAAVLTQQCSQQQHPLHTFKAHTKQAAVLRTSRAAGGMAAADGYIHAPSSEIAADSSSQWPACAGLLVKPCTRQHAYPKGNTRMQH